MSERENANSVSNMWADYEGGYRQALGDAAFLAWRASGARQKALNIMHVCRGLSVSSVLEIGCGTGAILQELASLRFAKEYVASDVSATAIEFVERSCRRFLSGAYVSSANSQPFPDGRFSVAVLSHVIEHLEDPASAVREAARVAEYVVIEVPTEKVFSNLVRTRLFGKPFSSAAEAGHLQFWTPGSIARFLEETCEKEIVARHTDLFSRQEEFHGREGVRKAKPLIKEALKSLLPARIYAQLLTTHATFLCQTRPYDAKSPRLGKSDAARERR